MSIIVRFTGNARKRRKLENEADAISIYENEYVSKQNTQMQTNLHIFVLHH